MRLEARSEELVSGAEVPWLAEAVAADIGPGSSDLVGIVGDVGLIKATLFPDVDGPSVGNKAAGLVNAVDSCCTSGFDTVLAAPEVGRVPLVSSPGDEDTSSGVVVLRAFWMTVLDSIESWETAAWLLGRLMTWPICRSLGSTPGLAASIAALVVPYLLAIFQKLSPA